MAPEFFDDHPKCLQFCKVIAHVGEYRNRDIGKTVPRERKSRNSPKTRESKDQKIQRLTWLELAESLATCWVRNGVTSSGNNHPTPFSVVFLRLNSITTTGSRAAPGRKSDLQQTIIQYGYLSNWLTVAKKPATGQRKGIMPPYISPASRLIPAALSLASSPL